MRNGRAARSKRGALFGFLGAGWLLGLVIQVATRVQTGYMDVSPPQLLLGVLLCLGAGAAVRVVDPMARRARRGALAGRAMFGSIIVGYALLAVVLWNPAWTERAAQQGEGWYSTLLEVPFWIGIPLAVAAGLGVLGWHAAGRMTARSRQAAPPP